MSIEFYVKCPYTQPMSGHWNTTMFHNGLKIETSRHYLIGSAASPLLLHSFCDTNALIGILNQNQTCISSDIISANVNIGLNSNLVHTQFLPSSLVVNKIDWFVSANTLSLGQLVENEPRILIVSRDNAKTNFFYKTMNEYVEGFSDGQSNFWIGLDTLHKVTSNTQYGLRVVATSETGFEYVEEYWKFRVGSAAQKYKLEVSGLFSNIGIGNFAQDNGLTFSTWDQGFNFMLYLI